MGCRAEDILYYCLLHAIHRRDFYELTIPTRKFSHTIDFENFDV